MKPKEEGENARENEDHDVKTIFIKYGGKIRDQSENALEKLNAPIKMIKTIKKVKTCLPSQLKAPVKITMKSGLVYRMT